jgi:hypothetical protein
MRECDAEMRQPQAARSFHCWTFEKSTAIVSTPLLLRNAQLGLMDCGDQCQWRRKESKASSSQAPCREWNSPVCGVYALGRPAGGSERISTAPALDTAAAVIIVVLPLSRKSSPGPKSFKRIAVWPTTAINAATITGMKSPRRSFL